MRRVAPYPVFTRCFRGNANAWALSGAERGAGDREGQLARATDTDNESAAVCEMPYVEVPIASPRGIGSYEPVELCRPD